MDLISVIVPVYNVKQYLPDCAASILGQTWPNLEVILVDDGSTDGSGAICDALAESDPRVRVIHKENGGLSSARNAGVACAKGSYVCFVDSDDVIAEDFVAQLYSAIQETGADGAWCHFRKFWGQLPRKAAEQPGKIRFWRKQELWKLLTATGDTGTQVDFVVAWTKLLPAEIARKLSFPEGKWHEDEFYIHRLLGEVTSMAEVDAPLYDYRQRPDSIVGESNAMDGRHLSMLEAFSERAALCRSEAEKSDYRSMVSALRNTYFIQYYNFRNQKDTARQIRLGYLKSWLRFPVFSWKDVKQGVLFLLNPGWYYKKYWGK